MRKQGQVQQALGQRYCSSKTTGPLHDRKTTSSLQPISSEVVDVRHNPCLANDLCPPGNVDRARCSVACLAVSPSQDVL